MNARALLVVTLSAAALAACSAKVDEPTPWAATVKVDLTGCAPAFLAPLDIAGTKFDVLTDTGSTTVAVAGGTCASCTKAKPAATYTPATGVDDHEMVSSSYGYGANIAMWTGEVFTDTVAIEGIPHDLRASFASMTAQTNFLDNPTSCGDGRGDGIMGLGPTLGGAPGTDSIVDKMVATGMPDIFAAQLCQSGGHLWLGGFDATVGSSAPVYAPLLSVSTTTPYYMVSMKELDVGGSTIAAPATSYGPAVLDTGSLLFAMPPDVFTALRASVEASAGYKKIFGTNDMFPATTITCIVPPATDDAIDAALPPLTMKLGDGTTTVTLPATRSYLMRVIYKGQAALCGGIQPGGVGGVSFILGYSVLRGNVTIFDRAGNRAGFMPFDRSSDCL